jgi:hypothetical protein
VLEGASQGLLYRGIEQDGGRGKAALVITERYLDINDFSQANGGGLELFGVWNEALQQVYWCDSPRLKGS